MPMTGACTHMTNHQTIRVAYEKALHFALENGISERLAPQQACIAVGEVMDHTQENMKALIIIMDEVKLGEI